jgi:hypothetical protein
MAFSPALPEKSERVTQNNFNFGTGVNTFVRSFPLRISRSAGWLRIEASPKSPSIHAERRGLEG